MLLYKITTLLDFDKAVRELQTSFEYFQYQLEWEEFLGEGFEKNIDYKKLALQFIAIENDLYDLQKLVSEIKESGKYDKESKDDDQLPWS